MKLYKFRPLYGDWLGWVKDIITTGNFRLSEWNKLNDPMEGFFYYDSRFEELLNNFQNLKEKRRVCCFSKNMNNILQWAHYADSFKGVAIEIEIKNDHENLYPIDYINNIKVIDLNSSSAEDVLTTKIKLWKYEKEYRYMKETEEVSCKIGKITGVYLGTRIESDHKEQIKNIFPKTFETELNFEKNKVVKKK
jgi:Protein of unknown function (DUF2971)